VQTHEGGFEKGCECAMHACTFALQFALAVTEAFQVLGK